MVCLGRVILVNFDSNYCSCNGLGVGGFIIGGLRKVTFLLLKVWFFLCVNFVECVCKNDRN